MLRNSFQTFNFCTRTRRTYTNIASLKSSTTFDKSTKVTLIGKNHNVESPVIACGTWSWGEKSQWGYDENRDLPGIKEVWSLLNNANLGFYDTAEVYGYGESERIIGKLLRDMPEDERSKVVIATKWLPLPIFMNRWIPHGIVGALKDSLNRLNMNSCDLYQVHAPWVFFYSIDTIAKGLAECVNLGLTKTVGVSNYSIENMITMYEALKKHGIPLASNQIEFSLLRRLPETSGLLAACHERHIIPLAYSPLAMGRLTGKYSVANPPPSGRRFSDYPMEEIEPLLEVMKNIAEKHNVPVSAVALNYVLCKGAIPLGGARNGKQAEQNTKALGWRLTNDEVVELEKYAKEGSISGWQKG